MQVSIADAETSALADPHENVGANASSAGGAKLGNLMCGAHTLVREACMERPSRERQAPGSTPSYQGAPSGAP
jgi:hypothetical protein